MKKLFYLLLLLMSFFIFSGQEIVTVMHHVPSASLGPLIYDIADSGVIACSPTCSLTTPASTQVGDLLVITPGFDTASTTISSVSGDGTWVASGECPFSDSASGVLGDMAHTLAATSAGAQTLTVTLSHTSNMEAQVVRYEGGSGGPYALDGTCQSLNNQASGSPKTPSITTTQSADLIISNIFPSDFAGPTESGGNSVTNLAGSGFTSPIFYLSSPGVNILEDNRSIGSGTHQAQFALKGAVTSASGVLAFSNMTDTGCQDVGYVNFTGTSGSNVTTTILNNSTSANVAIPGSWSLSGAITPKLASSGAQGPTNTFKNCNGGASHSANSATRGFSVTGSGSAQTGFAQYSLLGSYAHFSVGFFYEDNLVATDTAAIDCAIISAGTDFAAANCYGNGVNRQIELETSTSGHSSGIVISPSTWYWIVLTFNQNGTDSISVYDTSGTLLGTKTGAAANNPATNFSFGQTNGASITSGKVANWSSVKFSPFVFPVQQ